MSGPAGQGRDLLVHAHLFKNAGSTLDDSLGRVFGEAFLDHRDDAAMRRGADYLGPWIAAHPEIRALSSHWLTPPLPRVPGVRLHLLLLLRDPVERAASVYRFERRQEADAPGNRQARALDLSAYIHWRLQDGVGPVIRNYHTRYCSGDYHGSDLERMYRAALATLDSTPLVGLVERYAESMALFEYRLGTVFPGLDLSWEARNISGASPPGSPGLRAATLRELGPVGDRLLAANGHDLHLYERARRRFDRDLAAVPDLDERLRDLHARNRKLA